MGQSLRSSIHRTRGAGLLALVVSTDPAVRERIARGLVWDGCVVVTVVGVVQLTFALASAAAGEDPVPDALVVDARTLGEEAVRTVLRAHREDLPETLFVLTTADPGDLEGLAPCVAFRPPFDDDDLRTAVLHAAPLGEAGARLPRRWRSPMLQLSSAFGEAS